MNIPLTELQQFFGAYFNQDWVEDHACADDVIDSFLMDSSTDVICTVRNEILELIDSYTNESEFQENLLHKHYCFYYYPNEWASGPLWLHHIVEKFDTHLLKK
ncbi:MULTISPECIES: contact-dependent growth inhibition system immunity protein [unclassified Pseudomonas]|uniref:contact-dependent growth inhibition system immunity protein n=1 Tax=unclassified Pseudomonas TaxID=196821 RepID=UPI00249CE7ED|nr:MULTISPECIES: contact-dependent growth inhibition system immunity protein [unclassified Pseudomonas]MDI3252472.1 contact-dependent growth inhibition system immunity protein [Pseudomonas sp. AL10]MDI3268316.1 contact-dependent growth inhibition system immunity protein [Pseudomonas sp. AL15]